MSDNRTAPSNPVIVIPARMGSTRLPGKPLADICGLPMIIQCLRRAEEAAIGPVIVACGEAEIANAVTAAGGRAVLTNPDLPSGSDRVDAALREIDPNGVFDAVINLQGDEPTLDPALVRTAWRLLADPKVDIATLVAPIRSAEDRDNPNVVKSVIALPDGASSGRALYFSRATVPSGPGELFDHIGIYAYRRAALTRFVELSPSPLERREQLEMLRALEAGMRIDVAIVETPSFGGVDTPADLDRARDLMAGAEWNSRILTRGDAGRNDRAACSPESDPGAP